MSPHEIHWSTTAKPGVCGECGVVLQNFATASGATPSEPSEAAEIVKELRGLVTTTPTWNTEAVRRLNRAIAFIEARAPFTDDSRRG